MLVRSPGAGAIAVFSPTGLSDNGEAMLLGDRFFREASAYRTRTIGTSIRELLTDFHAAGGARAMSEIYPLLGDPAVTLSAHAPARGEIE